MRKKNDSGYGIAVYVKKISAKQLKDHKLMIAAWVKEQGGEYEGYLEFDLIPVMSNSFTYTEPVRIF
jgi:hypothetical protein